jgi:CRP-like cAMP-binding protein
MFGEIEESSWQRDSFAATFQAVAYRPEWDPVLSGGVWTMRSKLATVVVEPRLLVRGVQTAEGKEPPPDTKFATPTACEGKDRAAMEQLEAADNLWPAARRLRMLGVVSSGDLDAFLRRMKVSHGILPGETLASPIHSVNHLIVLLDGLACASIRHKDGGRQIYTFHHPGDFVGLHRFVFPRPEEHIQVEALASCFIGTIDYEIVDQLIQGHPSLGLALWRAAMIEANIVRERSAAMRRPALQRVAHLLFEQVARRSTVGIGNRIIPLNDMEVADATGLTVVQASRILQDLRKLGVLSEEQHTVEVVNKERLQELAVFDARYLDADESLSRWDVRLDG